MSSLDLKTLYFNLVTEMFLKCLKRLNFKKYNNKTYKKIIAGCIGCTGTPLDPFVLQLATDPFVL